LLITTSRSVTDTLLDGYGDALNLGRLAKIRLAAPSADALSPLGRVLADLATQATLSPADVAPFSALAGDAVDETAVAVTLFGAVNHRPAAVIRRLSPVAAAPPGENGNANSIRHTLLLLVEP
jgi:hypothetical protein